MAGTNQGGGQSPRVTPPARPQASAPAAPAAAPPRPFKVRATKLGYYDNLRRRQGDVFVVRKEADFSERWMERVAASTPENTTTPGEALRREHSNITTGRVPQLQPNAADLVPEEEEGTTGAAGGAKREDEVL